jgi:hypothetical protein
MGKTASVQHMMEQLWIGGNIDNFGNCGCFLPIALSSGLVSNIITQFCVTVIISDIIFTIGIIYYNPMVVFTFCN